MKNLSKSRIDCCIIDVVIVEYPTAYYRNEVSYFAEDNCQRW